MPSHDAPSPPPLKSGLPNPRVVLDALPTAPHPRPDSPAPDPAPPPVEGGSKLRFENEALPVLVALSSALKDLVNALPGPIEGPRDLQRALGIDYVLAWRTFKVAMAEEPAAVGADVARPAAMKGLLEAAQRSRVSPAVLDSVRIAYADFEDLVRRHAGEGPKPGRGTRSSASGRAVFDALIGGMRQGATPTLDLVNRRSVFKSNGYIWGVQAQTTYRCVIWHAGRTHDQIDGALLSGFTQLHALRSDVPVILKRMSGIMAEHLPRHGSRGDFQPPTGVRLLEEFSSRPLPELRSELNDQGHLDVSLRFEGIGKGAAVDCAMLEVMRNANNSVPQNHYRMQATSVMPAEVMLMVMLVPRAWCNPTTLKVSTHGNPAVMESIRTQFPPPFEMPTHEHAECLGSDLGALAGSDAPQLVAMIKSTLREQRCQDTEFEVFRCRVRFPVLHALVHFQVAGQ